MERVKKGEKYWFISGLFTVEARYESNGIMDTELFKVNNYFPASDYTPKMVNEMAEKIRKVLKGAIVIDKLPSEEEIWDKSWELAHQKSCAHNSLYPDPRLYFDNVPKAAVNIADALIGELKKNK